MKGIKSPEFGDPYIRSNLRKFINSEFVVKQFEVGQTHARRTVGHWVLGVLGVLFCTKWSRIRNIWLQLIPQEEMAEDEEISLVSSCSTKCWTLYKKI